MSRILNKYKRGYVVASMMLVMIFGLSSVSIAYTSVFCKMKMAETVEEESCCCKTNEVSETESEMMNCGEMSTGNELRFASEDGCCCEIKTVETTERNSAPAVALNTTINISHDGSLLFELPTPNNIPTTESISPTGKIVSDGRSVLTFNSVLRI